MYRITPFVLLLLWSPSAFGQTLSLSDTARILAGLSVDESVVEDFDSRLLRDFGEQMEEYWEEYEEDVGGPMADFAAEHLDFNPGDTVFYPFSGPDFITVHRLYPEATRYVLVALQHGGQLPDLTVSDAQTEMILQTVLDSMPQFADFGFFVTEEINNAFNYDLTPVDGISAAIAMMAEREGFRVVEMEPIQINMAGTDVVVHPGDPEARRTWRSVRFNLERRSDEQPVIVDYIRLDLANENLDENAAFRNWLAQEAAGRVVFKAASHLPQYDNFSTIVGLIVNNAISIVQDESGIEYSLLTEHFEVTLYGDLNEINHNFPSHLQADLLAAYNAIEDVERLSFPFGYYHPRRTYSVQVAHTRLVSE